MSERSSRRRLRLRRKRKGETFGSRVADAVDIVGNANAYVPLGDAAEAVGNAVGDLDVDLGDAAEVVGHMGCCVVEAVGSLAVLIALLTVPAYLLMH